MTYSELWGQSGELWRPDGPLPDFSFAGYRCGEEALPEPDAVSDVREFGAKGDGEHDDTQAFRDALARSPEGAVLVPEGRYRILGPLRIGRSWTVLRGAGSGVTSLYFPTPLDDLDPRPTHTAHGRPTTAYSWSGGFVSIEGERSDGEGVAVTVPAKRGDTTLSLASAERFTVGQRVEIVLTDDARRTLVSYLYAGDPGDADNIRNATRTFVVTVTDATPSSIAFDRPLRFDVRPEWAPIVRAYEPSVRECGVEGLAFEFPVTPYLGHFEERGHNALALTRASDCWLRDIVVENADSGMFVNADFCTIEGVVFRSARPDWNGATGHHGVILCGSDGLFTDFRFQTSFVHDLCVTGGSVGNVYSNGSGVDMNFDHHRAGPYENLFTDIDVGEGARLWISGGGPALGRHSGARETFWNIRAKRPLPMPPEDFGPAAMNVVALEADAPGDIRPRNIHAAQRDYRLANTTIKER